MNNLLLFSILLLSTTSVVKSSDEGQSYEKIRKTSGSESVEMGYKQALDEDDELNIFYGQVAGDHITPPTSPRATSPDTKK